MENIFYLRPYVIQLRMLHDYARLFIRKDFKIFTRRRQPVIMSCVNIIYVRIRLCVAPYSGNHASVRIVPVRLLSREFDCISVACVIGHGLILHAAWLSYPCEIQPAKELQSGIRFALRYLRLYIPLFQSSKVQVVNRLGWLVEIQSCGSECVVTHSSAHTGGGFYITTVSKLAQICIIQCLLLDDRNIVTKRGICNTGKVCNFH